MSGGGSGVGIASLINGVVDIANASRKMKAAASPTVTDHKDASSSSWAVTLWRFTSIGQPDRVDFDR